MERGPEFHLTSIFCRPMSYLSLSLHSSPLNLSLKGGYVYIYSKSTNASFFSFLFFLYLNIYKESIKELVSPTTISPLLKNIFKSFFSILFCLDKLENVFSFLNTGEDASMNDNDDDDEIKKIKRRRR